MGIMTLYTSLHVSVPLCGSPMLRVLRAVQAALFLVEVVQAQSPSNPSPPPNIDPQVVQYICIGVGIWLVMLLVAIFDGMNHKRKKRPSTTTTTTVISPEEIGVFYADLKRPSDVKALFEEEKSLIEVKEAFALLDVDEGVTISRDEFKRGIAKLELHRPEGSAPGWKDDAFDRFDADGNGVIDFNEMCFALGMEIFGARARGEEKTAKDCLQEVIVNLQVVQTDAKKGAMATAKSKKEIARLDEGRREKKAEEEGKVAADAAEVDKGVSETERSMDFTTCRGFFFHIIMGLFPCLIIVHGFGQAMREENKLCGMAEAVAYVTKGKKENPDFHWTIQNYHYKRVKKKNGTKRVRVNTHFARCSGALATDDNAATFVPRTAKRNLALISKLVLNFDSAFAGRFNNERETWYKFHTRDKHQDKREYFTLPVLENSSCATVRIEWVEAEEPWWANRLCRNLTAITWTAICWAHKMKGFMAADEFEFRKLATGYASEERRVQEEAGSSDFDDME